MILSGSHLGQVHVELFERKELIDQHEPAHVLVDVACSNNTHSTATLEAVCSMGSITGKCEVYCCKGLFILS